MLLRMNFFHEIRYFHPCCVLSLLFSTRSLRKDTNEYNFARAIIRFTQQTDLTQLGFQLTVGKARGTKDTYACI